MWRLLLVAALCGGGGRTRTSVTDVLAEDCGSCVERSEATVKMILHGRRDNSFWRLFAATAVQAARGAEVTPSQTS